MTANERKLFESGISEGFAPILTKEKHAEFMAKMRSMPDCDFEQLIAEIAHYDEEQQMTYRDYLEASMQLQKMSGVNNTNSAISGNKVRYMTKQECDDLWKDICKSRPSDSIFLKGEDDIKLCSAWRKSVKEEYGGIPSDLFFADGIPLMDCEITVDERDIPPESGGGNIVSYRVVIFPDYKERIMQAPDEPVTVGSIVVTAKDRHILVPIIVLKGFDYMLSSCIGYHNLPEQYVDKYLTVSELSQMKNALLSTWYGIQISLLHPKVKEVFSHHSRVRTYDSASKGKKRKRTTRYIRTHVIKGDEVEEAICGGSGRQINRHTLVWYVIGHWRHYSNGTKVFVKGYWKGTLRNLKQNIDKGRNRIIVLPEGGTI